MSTQKQPKTLKFRVLDWCQVPLNTIMRVVKIVSKIRVIYLPTPVDFKTLPVDLRNFLALEQHHRLLLLLWKKNAARKF